MARPNTRSSSGGQAERSFDKDWTEIDISSGGDPDLVDLELKNEDEEQEKATQRSSRSDLNVEQESQSERPEKAPKREEEPEDGTEIEEDKDEGQARQEQTRVTKGLPRAERRIRNLLGTNKELENKLNQAVQTISLLKKHSKTSELSSVKSQREQWENIIADKERALEAAIENSEPKTQAKLQSELADAQIKFNAYKAVENELENAPDDEEEPQNTQTQQQPEVPEATLDWVERNPWFRTDRRLHVLARTITAELIEEGEDPKQTKFYEELDSRMAETGVKLPNKNKKKGSPVSNTASGDDSPPPTRGKSQFTRVGNKVNVTPTADDREMARTLNVPLGKYLENKYKYEQQDYKGYVDIKI